MFKNRLDRTKIFLETGQNKLYDAEKIYRKNSRIEKTNLAPFPLH